MRVAIIGMGTAGVSVLRQLVKHDHFEKLKVDVYDDRNNMGQGVPFQNDSSELLINMPSKKMSLNLDDDEDFWKWYQHQQEFEFDNPTYLPRFVFGHYMKSYLSKFDDQYENITIINHKVREIFTTSKVDETNLKYYVCTSDDMKEWREYDYLFLTFGTFAYHDPYHLKGIKGFKPTPYPTYNSLDDVNEDDRIAILGTGLASLDVIRYVTAHHPRLPILMTSRSANLPSVRGQMVDIEFTHLTKQKFNDLQAQNYGNVPLDIAVDLFLKECSDYGIDFEKLINRRTGNHINDLKFDLEHEKEMGIFQSIIEYLKENLNWIWNSLSFEDQQRFQEKYTKMIQLNSNPMPPRTAKLLIELLEKEALFIRKNLKNVYHEDGLFHLQYENENDIEDFNVVINATGSKNHLSELDEDDQLIRNLENRQIVQSHPMGGIQIIPETNQVISPRFGTLTNVIAIGQMTNGVNKLRNGVKMIVNQVANAVDRLYDTQQDFENINEESI
ncbi:FAD/NAD(P)-binding protein [Staphylococcus warneri]|uniref:FAD/NAD(P)-binding protein n=2 Tax=Staphylococcus warneri TaxID=1292 RepID=UPI000735EBA4|nr:FAD/NAD(P)-binding protein [Staphylococcus warneri]AXZ23127.1 pyridine nucleotide-disulfide oxidoreductase [Staphylococcus warneri]KTW09013.1 pyridine nucleotide-disulfide oxidoreductase [Staphylococcus warneri]OIS42499.1 pyridine nucleotide-disulfide oxidoreductase [Staphylococcus warneri]OIS47421.1 pyridine nucleotide-disulfide oxidoreductase [Staphylococcus warneri]PTI05555.1 pyridine nucleotide-disulfide oxidoreductase [Staphylococcus warneri]